MKQPICHPWISWKLTLHWNPHYRIVEWLSVVNYLQTAFPASVIDAERNVYQELSPDTEKSG